MLTTLRSTTLFCVALLLLTTCGNPFTRPTPLPVILTGQVTDASSGEPLSSVTVTAQGLVANTGTDGRYQLVNLSPGTFELTARRAGYASVTQSVSLGRGSNTVDIRMTRE